MEKGDAKHYNIHTIFSNKERLTAFACKELRFAIAFLFVFFPRLQFSGVSRSLKQKNILNTIEQLI